MFRASTLEASARSEDVSCGTSLAEFAGLLLSPFGDKLDENREKVTGWPLELIAVNNFTTR